MSEWSKSPTADDELHQPTGLCDKSAGQQRRWHHAALQRSFPDSIVYVVVVDGERRKRRRLSDAAATCHAAAAAIRCDSEINSRKFGLGFEYVNVCNFKKKKGKKTKKEQRKEVGS